MDPSNAEKPKVVFVIAVADPDIPMISWLSASMLAAKRYNAGLEVILVTDDQTPIEGDMRRAVSIPDDVVTVPSLSDASPRHRSRYVKSQIRNVCDHSLVYLDADALCIDSIEGLYSGPADLACTPDSTTDFERMHSWMRPAFATFDWRVPEDLYLSSGVFYLADNERTKGFGRRWHDYWQKWREIDKSGFAADQPSFNAAILDSDLEVEVKGSEFNWVVDSPFARLDSPLVLHYPASLTVAKRSILSRVAAEWKSSGRFAEELIDVARDRGRAFVGSRLAASLETSFGAASRRLSRYVQSRLSPEERSRRRI